MDTPGARSLTEAEVDTIKEIKAIGDKLMWMIGQCGQSRELSIARTKTEEAVMWAVKHVTS